MLAWFPCLNTPSASPAPIGGAETRTRLPTPTHTHKVPPPRGWPSTPDSEATLRNSLRPALFLAAFHSFTFADGDSTNRLSQWAAFTCSTWKVSYQWQSLHFITTAGHRSRRRLKQLVWFGSAHLFARSRVQLCLLLTRCVYINFQVTQKLTEFSSLFNRSLPSPRMDGPCLQLLPRPQWLHVPRPC